MKRMRNMYASWALVLATGLMASAAQARNIDEWNLEDGNLAVQGYDPVTYFAEGGSEPMEGSIELNHDGVVYRFVSQANLEQFQANPDKYEPAHGGWCSTAMAFGQKIGIDPTKYVVSGNRLFLFSFLNGNDARDMWNDDPRSLERRADFNWKRISGEEARR